MLDTSLFDGWLPIVGYGLAIVFLLYLIIRPPTKVWLLHLAGALVASLIVQAVLVLIIDYWLLPFGIPLEFRNWAWVYVAVLGTAIAVVNLWRSRWWRKLLAVIGIVSVVLASTLAINATYGQYPTLRDALGLTSYPELPASLMRSAATVPPPGQTLAEVWEAPVDLPAKGGLYETTIPATKSGFPARRAVIYLPPAALVDNPPALPVVIALSGQPGDPSNIFTSGQLGSTLDKFASEHGGLAPIIVAADQLGTEYDNPMCIDGPLGNSQTYLSTDVPNWIQASLPVSLERTSWTIGGFSQGGICSLQLAAEFPEVYGSFIDISGDEKPTLGDDASTLALGFNGDKAAYEAAQPLNFLKKRDYSDVRAVFAVGKLDNTFGPQQRVIAKAAEASGMQTDLITAPDSGHDWATARFGFTKGLELLYTRMGLTS